MKALFRIKPMLIVLLVVLAVIQYKLWFEKGGINSLSSLKQQVAEKQSATDKMRDRNDRLAAEVRSLKKGSEPIESRARSELGMVKKGETYYQVVDPK